MMPDIRVCVCRTTITWLIETSSIHFRIRPSVRRLIPQCPVALWFAAPAWCGAAAACLAEMLPYMRRFHALLCCRTRLQMLWHAWHHLRGQRCLSVALPKFCGEPMYENTIGAIRVRLDALVSVIKLSHVPAANCLAARHDALRGDSTGSQKRSAACKMLACYLS